MGEGIAVGALVALANGLGAWLIICWAFAQPPRLFPAVILGGMVIRIVAVSLVSVALLKLAAVRPGPYLIGLGVTILAVQVGEVVLILRKARKNNEIGDGQAGSRGGE
jgi:hypothetical protein